MYLALREVLQIIFTSIWCSHQLCKVDVIISILQMGQRRLKEFGTTITLLVTARGEFPLHSEVYNFNI